ncbi:hypothetical protein EON64_10515 [archaeon]|nr:MAG: hypothetical protein EON64_10515 [archaeon]
MISLWEQRLAKLYWEVFHTCAAHPVKAIVFEKGFVRTPWRCPQCELIADEDELRYELAMIPKGELSFESTGLPMPQSAQQQIVRVHKCFSELMSIDDPRAVKVLDNLLYSPDRRLKANVGKMAKFLLLKKPTQKQKQAAGYLLETICFLTFEAIKGGDWPPKSYQSTGPQIDLLATGNSSVWRIFCSRAGINPGGPAGTGILVESKAIGKPVGDAIVQRVFAMANLQFKDTVRLGVVLSLKGISGEPNASQTMRVLRDARLTQVLAFALHSVPIVSISWADIQRLHKPGELVRMIRAKILEFQQLGGFPTSLPKSAEAQVCPLPAHMAALVKKKKAKLF